MSINKLAYSGHFELKFEYLRLSEAELGIPTLAMPGNGFSRFTRIQSTIELRVAIQAQINSPIAVILSTKSSLYDLQKQR